MGVSVIFIALFLLDATVIVNGTSKSDFTGLSCKKPMNKVYAFGKLLSVRLNKL